MLLLDQVNFLVRIKLPLQQKRVLLKLNLKMQSLLLDHESIKLPFIPEDKRIFSSTGALELADIKGDLIVLGGGIIGLEMATVYAALGVEVTVVEFMDQLIPGADTDLVTILQKRMAKKGVKFLLKTKVTGLKRKKMAFMCHMEGAHATDKPLCFKQVLVAVGRKPNGGHH